MNIHINGKETTTSETTLAGLRRALYGTNTDLVSIVDGYQTDDLPLKEGGEVFFIQRGELPPRDCLEQMLCARHTPGVYEKVKRARVAVAGLGGLGSNIALMLARTGVGHLHLVDFDRVEPSNLNRQQYRICHLGHTKAEAMVQQIAEVNPCVEVTAEPVRVTPQNAVELFADDGIVCEAFDDPDAKSMLVECLLTHYPAKKVVASSGMAGYGSSNRIITKKLGRQLYICGDFETEAQPGCGLMAPRVAVCAGHQANMVLRLICGKTEP